MNNYIDGWEVRRRLLLDKYYAAETSQDEELELYALLLDVQEGDEYYEDAILLRSQFEVDHRPSTTICHTHKDRRWLWGLSIAASIAIVCLGLWSYHEVNKEPMLAMRNNTTMTQEEVNAVVNDAMLRMNNAFAKSNRAREKAMGLLEQNLPITTRK